MRELGQSLIILSVISLITAPAFGAIKSWDAGGDGTSWGDASNWDPDGVPVDNVDHVYIINGGTVDLGGVGRNRESGTSNLIVNTIITNSGAAVFLNFGSNFRLVEIRDCTLDKSLNFTVAGSSGPVLISNTIMRAKSGGGNIIFMVNGGAKVTIIDGQFRADGNGDHAEIIAQFAGQDHTIEIIGGNHDFDDFRINSRSGSVANGRGVFILSNAIIRCGTSGTPNYHNSVALSAASTGSSTIFDHGSVTRFDSHLVMGTQCTYRASGLTRLRFRSTTLNKDIDLRMTNETFFDGEGLIINADAENNSETELEICSGDLGAVFAGFHDNFSIDELRFTTTGSGSLTLEDDRDNTPGAGSAEVIYSDLISFSNSNATINDGGNTIYYKSIHSNGFTFVGGILVQVTGAALFTNNFTFEPEPLTTKTATVGGGAVSVTNDYGTAIATGAAVGDNIKVLLDLDGTAGNIALLKSDLGAFDSGGGFDLEMQFPGAGAGGTDLLFDWSFSHRSVTLNRLQVDTFDFGTVVTVE